MEQNKILHSQFESISARLQTLHDSSSVDNLIAPSSNTSISDVVLDSEKNLSEVIKYLRREKDILERENEILQQKMVRLQQQVDHLQRSLDETRSTLDAVCCFCYH